MRIVDVLSTIGITAIAAGCSDRQPSMSLRIGKPTQHAIIRPYGDNSTYESVVITYPNGVCPDGTYPETKYGVTDPKSPELIQYQSAIENGSYMYYSGPNHIEGVMNTHFIAQCVDSGERPVIESFPKIIHGSIGTFEVIFQENTGRLEIIDRANE